MHRSRSSFTRIPADTRENPCHGCHFENSRRRSQPICSAEGGEPVQTPSGSAIKRLNASEDECLSSLLRLFLPRSAITRSPRLRFLFLGP